MKLFRPNHAVVGRVHAQICNRFDQHEVEKSGADKACAQWIIGGNHGSVRFKYWKTEISSFKPDFGAPIEAIKFVESGVNSQGIRYLGGLKFLKDLSFQNCPEVDDLVLAKLAIFDCVEKLRFDSCPKITETGLCFLTRSTNLKRLELRNLDGVQRKQAIIQFLAYKLPEIVLTTTTGIP